MIQECHNSYNSGAMHREYPPSVFAHGQSLIYVGGLVVYKIRVGGEFGLGVTVTYADVDISLNYDIEVREDYTSQTGMVRARYNF